MKKTGPVVIVSLDALNDRLDTITVCQLAGEEAAALRRLITQMHRE